MDDGESRMQQRFVELAPWYVNGTASEGDRAWVDEYVRSHPAAAAELEWYASLQRHIKEDTPDAASEIGLSRVLDRIHREQPRQAHVPTRDSAPHGFGAVPALVANWLGRPAYAFATAALVLVQAGVIGGLVVKHRDTEREYAEFRSIATVPATAPLLRVSFKPESRESDIRFALVDVGGVLVGGPGQLGEYLVRVPTHRIDAALSSLRNNGAVEAVDISAPPPR
jgi:hypothetical protein